MAAPQGHPTTPRLLSEEAVVEVVVLEAAGVAGAILLKRQILKVGQVGEEEAVVVVVRLFL